MWSATLRGLALALTLSQSVAAQDLQPSGTVKIEQIQVAFVFSGNIGGGVLTFEGKTYEFEIGGLGVGGIGASSIEARGTVYNLRKLSDFAGAYGQARAGFAVGTTSSGTLWLQNGKGVYMELTAERKGLALSLGADAIYVDF